MKLIAATSNEKYAAAGLIEATGKVNPGWFWKEDYQNYPTDSTPPKGAAIYYTFFIDMLELDAIQERIDDGDAYSHYGPQMMQKGVDDARAGIILISDEASTKAEAAKQLGLYPVPDPNKPIPGSGVPSTSTTGQKDNGQADHGQS